MPQTPAPPFNIINPNKTNIEKSRNTYQGSEKAKKYLIKSDKETNEAYQIRQNSLVIKETFKKGIDNIINIIFRKPLVFSEDMNPSILEMYKTADGTQNLNEFIKKATLELLLTNRCYIQVWTNSENPDRPFLQLVKRERIPYIYRDGFSISQIAVKGSYLKMIDRYNRESADENKIYFSDGVVEVWRDDKLYNTIQTQYNQVPFVETVFSGEDYDYKTDLPPFLDLAKTELEAMNTQSDKRAYIKKLAHPFIVAWGMDLADGTDGVSVDTDGVTKVSFAYEYGYNFPVSKEGHKLGDIELREYNGTNDTVLEKELQRLEDQIKEGFVSFISGESGNKTVTESENERVAGESALSAIATKIEDMVNQVNKLFFEMSGKTDNKLTGKIGTIKVNHDFLSTKLTTEQATLLLELSERGKLTDSTYLKLLQEGGELKGVDLEDEIKKLEAGVK